MQAVRVHGQGDIRFESVPEPARPGPTEVLIAPVWAGLCGTDVKEYAGPGGSVSTTPHPQTGAKFPQILGHEFSATVVATGSAVSHVRAGDPIVAMPLRWCGSCWACTRGEHILCPNKAWVGLSTPWGGLGDLALVEAYQATHRGALTAEQGALVEPAAVSLNAVLRTGVGPGDTVLIVGAGPVGALALQSCVIAGAAAVYVSDPNPQRAALAIDLGAAEVLSGDLDGQTRRLLELTDGVGVDRAVDCAGKDRTLDFCVHSVRPGGTVGVPSVQKGSTSVDVRTMTRKPVTVAGSLGYTEDVWHRTIALIAAGAYPVERIVTSRIVRDQVIEDGFESLARADRGQLKILVDVGAS